jgi:queuosine precursor transporter
MRITIMEQQQGFKYFEILSMLFVAVLLISNIAAQKLFVFGPFVFTCGILLFPVSYIFGDILTEVYGYARSRIVIWTGLACNLLMVLVLSISVWLPPAPGWPFQEQFAATLGMVPRIVAASMLGYWAGEFSNSFTLAKMKILTNGRWLWTRTIGSTVVGEAVDTVVFVLVAFGGILPSDVIIKTIISGYLFKVVYEVIATPITYAIVGFLKRKEGVDTYDRYTNFNPFRLRID